MDDGQPAQAPFMCRNTVPFSKPRKVIATILRDGRTDAGLEQFLDRHDDLGIGLVVEFACAVGPIGRILATGRHDGRTGHELFHDGAENGGLEMLPVRAVLGDGDEVVAEEHAGDAGDLEEAACQGRGLPRLLRVAEIGGALREHFTAGQEL